MFRYKTIFSDKLQSRQVENQFQEMIIKCAVLNRMTHLGMPDSYIVNGQQKVETGKNSDLCNKAVYSYQSFSYYFFYKFNGLFYLK